MPNDFGETADNVYNCKLCGKTVPARTPAIRVLLATRPAVYPFRKEVNRISPKPHPQDLHPHDPGGRGTEIVREALVCADCAADKDI